jgi:tetratricopeptide (TPR) repeat protein
LRLNGLDTESAVTLILEASKVRERDVKSTQQARHIAGSLDHHPLALAVASSLIESTTYSLEEYAEALATRFTQSELLNTESEQATYRKVSATFEVSANSLTNLAKSDPSARDALALLDILSLLHNQGVPEDIFIRAWDYAEKIASRSPKESWQSVYLTSWHVAQSQYLAISGTSEQKKRAFRRGRAHLIKMSLVSIDATGCVISLHSLVHTWARERLQHPVEAWTATASILSLSTNGDFGWQSFTYSLAKHLEACFAFRRSTSATMAPSLEICRIWYAFAWQMEWAFSPGATELCQRIVEDLSGREDVEDLLVSSQHLLGVHYLRHGQTPQAIEVLEHVVAVRETQLEVGHYDRLLSQNQLASAYLKNGQISRAIEILENVVKVREKLAEDHPNRLASQNNLAGAYEADGQISRAIEILEHVVKVQEKLADDHPSRLVSQQALASTYRTNGQIPQAIEILEHVVKVEEKLADDHPGRLANQHELARAYKANGQALRAIGIFEHVVKIQEKLANNHPDRLSSQHNLAAAYWENGQDIEAECLFRQVVAIRQKSLRADHPNRVASEGWLALIIRKNTKATEPSPDVSAGAEHVPHDSSPLSARGNVVDTQVAIARRRDMLRNIRAWRAFLPTKRSRV